MTTETDGFPCEWHSDTDGDRHVVVDADLHDLTGWSVDVQKSDAWMKGIFGPDWTRDPDDKPSRRAFSRTMPWYRSATGGAFGHIRYSKDLRVYPWSVMVDHGEEIVRWVPPAPGEAAP